MTSNNAVLDETLRLAVPMWVHELRSASAADLARIAAECCDVVAGQGDVLQYGGKRRFGQGTRERLRHEHAPRCAKKDCSCEGEGCAASGCYCHLRGEPSYSAGEVFNYLARGLACLAHAPGGVTFAGLHFCTDHDVCTGKRKPAVTNEQPAAGTLAETIRVIEEYL